MYMKELYPNYFDSIVEFAGPEDLHQYANFVIKTHRVDSDVKTDADLIKSLAYRIAVLTHRMGMYVKSKNPDVYTETVAEVEEKAAEVFAELEEMEKLQ